MRNVQREKKLNLDFAFLVFSVFVDFSLIPIGFPLISLWKPTPKPLLLWKLKMQNRVELFLSLHVSHHSFVVTHSFLMFLGALESVDRPLFNEPKNINFQNGKLFFRTRWKKVLIKLMNTLYYRISYTKIPDFGNLMKIIIKCDISALKITFWHEFFIKSPWFFFLWSRK